MRGTHLDKGPVKIACEEDALCALREQQALCVALHCLNILHTHMVTPCSTNLAALIAGERTLLLVTRAFA